jgi:hypothetical protein
VPLEAVTGGLMAFTMTVIAAFLNAMRTSRSGVIQAVVIQVHA